MAEQNENTSINLEEIASRPNNNNDVFMEKADSSKRNGYEDLTAIDKVPLEPCGNELSAKSAQSWRCAALIVAWTSVIILSVLGITSFGVSTVSKSSAAFGFGFDCILDVGTSAVVIWRFYGSIGSLYSAVKERIALLFLGCLFSVASVSIFARCISDLISQQHPKHSFILLILAAVSGVACTILAIAKFVIAKKLNSRSIKTDGYCSLAGAITGFSILLTTNLIEKDRHLWYLDGIVGLCVALLLLFYGLKVLIDVIHEFPHNANRTCAFCQTCKD